MQRPNILLIMSDEHDPAVTGCYGHSLVQTPNLDRLAQEGNIFDNAYCNSPMCCPSRMSFLTGRYASDVNIFDNGSPLALEVPTFAHYLEACGYETILCGRMHMIGHDRHHGFGTRLYDDMSEWTGYHQKAQRTMAARRGSNSHVTECGPGEAAWLNYDRTVTDLGERFLQTQINYPSTRPWLFIAGFMNPHFPLWVPQSYFDLYPPEKVILPEMRDETLATQHPVIQQLRYCFRNDEAVPEAVVRSALASYYALVTLTDEHIGRLVQLVDGSSLRENTIVIYVSDHGEMAGQHGIWQKQCFYEASVRVPLIIRGPGLTKQTRIDENVSLVDIMPTLLDFAGTASPNELRGESLKPLLEGAGGGKERAIFSEYHAQGMLNAGYMIKKGHWKYNYYVDAAPQLFDLNTDPGEFIDLSQDPRFALHREGLHQELLQIVDPEEVDRLAKINQAKEGVVRAYT